MNRNDAMISLDITASRDVDAVPPHAHGPLFCGMPQTECDDVPPDVQIFEPNELSCYG